VSAMLQGLLSFFIHFLPQKSPISPTKEPYISRNRSRPISAAGGRNVARLLLLCTRRRSHHPQKNPASSAKEPYISRTIIRKRAIYLAHYYPGAKCSRWVQCSEASSPLHPQTLTPPTNKPHISHKRALHLPQMNPVSSAKEPYISHYYPCAKCSKWA